VLDKSKIKRDFEVAVPYWTDSLEKCMAQMKEESANSIWRDIAKQSYRTPAL